MVPVTQSRAASMVVAALLVLFGNAAAASGIQTSLGDDVPLAGSSTAGPFVYLFLTGPNLPENGVALHDITRRSDQGYFTKISVDGDDRWSYTWHTASIGGRLDAGTYTIWVLDAPSDRSRLAYTDYGTITITLGKPSISVDTPAQPGGIDLQSVPEGASVTVNGEFRGRTPLTLSGISPGTYTIGFSLPGFSNLTTPVRVEQGKISEVVATLQPETGTLSVNSTPSGARVMVDGTAAGFSPVILANISAGNHTVTVAKDGYATADRQVGISAGGVYMVEVTLEPLPVATTATRSAGTLPAMAGALLVIVLYGAGGRRN